jgi:putative peptidoglycan lipid II flippase
MTIYSNAWLLLQVPYGVLGVSLLTAIMPRLSKAAATGDLPGVVDNLSTGSRLSAVMLIPICALMTVLGPQIGIALFSIRHGMADQATELGLALTISSFGIVFYAITMLQLRVFYAMNDARTPTLINGIMVVVKVILFYACAHLLDPHHRVYGLAFVNGLGFLIAAMIGEVWVRKRIGQLETGRLVRTVIKAAAAAAWGAAGALLVAKGFNAALPDSPHLRAWLTLILGSVVGLGLTFGVMTMLRVGELSPVTNRLARLARRG